MRFGRKGKLSPRFVGSFEILKKWELWHTAWHCHRISQVSMTSFLRRYMSDRTHVLDSKPLLIHPNMTYEEAPTKVLDRKKYVLKNKSIPRVKILWNNHSAEEASWELEDVMREKYPHLFD
ncbi:hypothetical protein SLA2020_380700 [Shorea laevis]